MSNESAEVIAKVQPKLRMVANGSTEVNALRAEHAAAVSCRDAAAERFAVQRGQHAVPSPSADVETTWAPVADDPGVRVSAFLQLAEDLPADSPANRRLEGETARSGRLVTAELDVASARRLGEESWLAYAELGQPLDTPEPVVTAADPPEPAPTVRTIAEEPLHRFGTGVLVGLIDVGGFDFAHPDFLDESGHTRFVRIWDQGGDGRDPPPAFGYGAEIRKDHLDRAIDEAPVVSLPPQLLEPQSQAQPGSHATHVASIAAGNHGVCRKAWIAGVTISIPEADGERRRSFYDSTRLAHAVDYLLGVAQAIKEEHDLPAVPPVSINVSLGTNGHAHDDSSAVSRWIDAALTQPGRSVCVAAGNAGQDRAAAEGDIGWIMGRIHASGQIRSAQLVADLEWSVVGNGVCDLSENELEIWYGPQDRFGVQVKPPGQDWTEVIDPGEFVENRQLPSSTFLSIYNEVYHPSNGANYIAVYLSPKLSEPVVGVPAGEWLVRLVGREVRDGGYHAWIERDDPRKLGRVGSREAWIFPSFFSERSHVDNSTVSSLACGQRIVSVANLDEERRLINITSSQGPTRDGRQKPDIAAPGTDIVAARGFAPGGGWLAMSGTSMASPHVAGVIGLMLATNPRLTGAQIGGIIKRTAQPLPGADFSWLDDAGSGVVDPRRCVLEAEAMKEYRDRTVPPA